MRTWMLLQKLKGFLIDQDVFDHDKGQKSAISGRRLHWILNFLQLIFPILSRFFLSSQWIAKNVEKIAQFPGGEKGVQSCPRLMLSWFFRFRIEVLFGWSIFVGGDAFPFWIRIWDLLLSVGASRQLMQHSETSSEDWERVGPSFIAASMWGLTAWHRLAPAVGSTLPRSLEAAHCVLDLQVRGRDLCYISAALCALTPYVKSSWSQWDLSSGRTSWNLVCPCFEKFRWWGLTLLVQDVVIPKTCNRSGLR